MIEKNDNIEFRKASIDDIPLIQELTKNVWPNTYKDILSEAQIDYMLEMIYSTEALQKQMLENYQQFIIVSESGADIAFAAFSKISEHVFKLHKLYALASQQGKGLGRKMIDFIINEIKKVGATSLQLNVNRHNKAMHFYQHLGFDIIEEKDIDIGNGYFMNDFIMEKKL